MPEARSQSKTNPGAASDLERLSALEDRLDALSRTKAPPAPQEMQLGQAQLAWQLVIEMVAGIVIGFGIGLGLDTLLGTTPWFMVLFILLGFAAGVKTMLSSVRKAEERRLAAEAEASEGKERGD